MKCNFVLMADANKLHPSPLALWWSFLATWRMKIHLFWWFWKVSDRSLMSQLSCSISSCSKKSLCHLLTHHLGVFHWWKPVCWHGCNKHSHPGASRGIFFSVSITERWSSPASAVDKLVGWEETIETPTRTACLAMPRRTGPREDSSTEPDSGIKTIHL